MPRGDRLLFLCPNWATEVLVGSFNYIAGSDQHGSRGDSKVDTGHESEH